MTPEEVGRALGEGWERNVPAGLCHDAGNGIERGEHCAESTPTEDAG